MSAATLLVVDPAPEARAAAVSALGRDFAVLEAPDTDAACRLLAENWVQAVFMDAGLAGSLARRIDDAWPETLKVVLSDAPAPPRGCDPFQLLPKPCAAEALLTTAHTAAAHFEVQRENARLRLEAELARARARPEPATQTGFERLLCTSGSPMEAAIETARLFASFDVPVLLTAPEGAETRIMAEAIHGASLRGDRAFLSFDARCATLEQAEFQLFGTPRSASHAARPGLLAKADRGTLFIAGIEHLAPSLQTALAELVTTGELTVPGATEGPRWAPRLIASAAALDVVACCDLRYALTAGQIALPPLRDRPRDIPALAQSILTGLSRRHGKVVRGLGPETLAHLTAHDWPGDVAELTAELLRMLMLAQDPMLGADLLSPHLMRERAPNTGHPSGTGALKARVEAVEREILRETLTRLKWNKTRAAAELGLSRVGLRAKLDRYAIAPRQLEES